jgi:hypothetical protein
MGKLHDMLTEQLRELPRLLLTELVRDKLTELGHGENERLLVLLVDDILAGQRDEQDDANSRFVDIENSCGIEGELTIDFLPEDIERLDKAVAEFQAELPDLFRDTADVAAKTMLKQYRRDWTAWRPHDLVEFDGFRLRLQARWKKGFDALHMLIEIARDIGVDYQKRGKRSRSTRRVHIGPVLMHLHVRALQIASEMMVLMENGFADGAMARWRTLHEITCVATLIDAGGDALAERYLLHEYVEARKSLIQFQASQPLLGYMPFSKREVARIEQDYQAVLTRFGKSFGTDYGWAADYLGETQPTFRHIEDAAGRAKMRSHYKMASQNVHAGTKGIAHRLGAMNERYAGIAGASNVGFLEPGQNLAISLTLITTLLLPKRVLLDELAQMAHLRDLQDQIPKALARAHRAIRREDAEKASKRADKPR